MQPVVSRTTQVRAVIIAKGDVQRVGYRDAVERIARKMKFTGFIENIKPYDVRIVCEGEKGRVEAFIKQININEFPIDVEDLDVKFEDATGEFEYFEIKRGDWTEELGERLDSARAELKQNTLTLKEFRNETNEVLKGFREDSNDNFKLLHSDMTKHDAAAQNRIEKLSKEITELRERITRVESVVATQQ